MLAIKTHWEVVVGLVQFFVQANAFLVIKDGLFNDSQWVVRVCQIFVQRVLFDVHNDFLQELDTLWKSAKHVQRRRLVVYDVNRKLIVLSVLYFSQNVIA